MEDKDKAIAFTLRLKPHIVKLLDKTADTIGLDRTATVTNAIRAYAKKEGIQIPPEGVEEKERVLSPKVEATAAEEEEEEDE